MAATMSPFFFCVDSLDERGTPDTDLIGWTLAACGLNIQAGPLVPFCPEYVCSSSRQKLWGRIFMQGRRNICHMVSFFRRYPFVCFSEGNKGEPTFCWVSPPPPKKKSKEEEGKNRNNNKKQQQGKPTTYTYPEKKGRCFLLP